MSATAERVPAPVAAARVAVLMTCHNRVARTTQCLEALMAQRLVGWSVEVCVVDDGSTDGTSAAVARLLPTARVLQGDGSLFWCGGMRLAFGHALRNDYDFYLWLNDDTVLEPDALSRLAHAYHEEAPQGGEAVIVVGSTRDPTTGQFSYGGWRRRARPIGPVTWQKAAPDMGNRIACDTFNGNCVLVSRAAARLVGNIDPAFRQALGDLDYGLRAAACGCRIIVAPGYFGACPQNDGKGMWTDRTLGLLERWRALIGPKGLPVASWRLFTQRHKGRLWLISWLAPYVLIWFDPIRRPWERSK